MNSTPHETDEWRPVTITTANPPGTITAGISYSIVPNGERPGAWTPAEVRGSQPGVRITGLPTGLWRVYAQLISPPDTPVIDCGTFQID